LPEPDDGCCRDFGAAGLTNLLRIRRKVMSSIIAAIMVTLSLATVTCGLIWDIDFRYRRCLQHLDDARLVRGDLQSIVSSAIFGLAGIISLTVTDVDLVGDVAVSSLRKGLLLAVTAPPLALAAVFLVRRLRSGHASPQR
jgi:hypothetical protein